MEVSTIHADPIHGWGSDTSKGGTGGRFSRVVLILAGVAALSATLLTVVSVWLQAKNYRKPLLQRYVVRILLMVPIYSAASWASLISLRVAFWIDPFRDVYEAFTIYTFFQLLINFMGGERALIITMYGRPPVSHLWPLNHVLPKVDISDPYTFLAIKRGILQYAWIKPVLALATIIMKATGTYQEGYIGISSGYFWSGLIYNVSISISLYALALFWVCMNEDLKPFRPMPKFLCVKGIIFASYWQGFFLSILVWLGALPDDVAGYTPDNLAASIQDALICFEMPAFALAHWYAFSWHDYADITISAARMPVKHALRDAFGSVDLIQDTKETFRGRHYEYRHFDADNDVLAHEESTSRTARMQHGMRYERAGKRKYWIPAPGQGSRAPLLGHAGSSRARTMSPGMNRALDPGNYGTSNEVDALVLDPEDERLFESARSLEFGDWNYPVITAHTPSFEQRRYRDPRILTAASNRHLIQPTKQHEHRRKSHIADLRSEAHQGEDARSSSRSGDEDARSKGKGPSIQSQRRARSSSSSVKSNRSQLVDLVVEDHAVEEIERVRARKDGDPAWNQDQPKHFVRMYPTDELAQEVREGYDPAEPRSDLNTAFAIADDWADEEQQGEPSRNRTDRRFDQTSHHYGSDEQAAWGSDR